MIENKTGQLFGFYRAKVVTNVDSEKFGRILVYIPSLMPEIPDTSGIWARPANNPIGGRNVDSGTDENYYMGTSYIPRKGSWVFVFFESGQINRPYYIGALDLENAKVLPENQVGSNFQDKWTIFKSHDGRTIIISDDPDDARVEITGKKRKLNTPPSGDLDSVYEIDENQTTILLDERTDKEKILIRTYKGDFLHIDIDEQNLHIYFKNDINIKCEGNLNILTNGSINIKSSSDNVNIEANADINHKSGGSIKQSSGADMHVKAGGNCSISSSGSMNQKAGGNFNIDGAMLSEQGGAATTASNSSGALDASPVGDRNT